MASLDLPAGVRDVLADFLQSLVADIGPQLKSVVLFGSAAEGRMRPTSDVNLLVLADCIDESRLGALREPLRSARAAVGLTVMFVEESEFSDACEAFALKFADIKSRHVVLYGGDPLAESQIPRAAAVRRLRQVLLNLKIRLRERYALDGDMNDRIAAVLADLTGPLRVSAAALLALQDGRERAPKPALEEFCREPRWAACLGALSAVHRGEVPGTDAVRQLVADVILLLSALADAASMLA